MNPVQKNINFLKTTDLKTDLKGPKRQLVIDQAGCLKLVEKVGNQDSDKLKDLENAVTNIFKGMKEGQMKDNSCFKENVNFLKIRKAKILYARAVQQMETGDLQGAHETANQIQDRWKKANALTDIAAREIESGDVNRAKSTLKETGDVVFQDTLPTEQLLDYKNACQLIIELQMKIKDEQGANETLNRIFDPQLREEVRPMIGMIQTGEWLNYY